MSEFIAKFSSDADFLLKCLVAVGALFAFAIGLLQYRRSQLWKRKEFLGAEIKAFLCDPIVRNALLMVDWSSRRIPFDPKTERSTWPKVTREFQVGALQPYTLRLSKSAAQEEGLRKFTEVEAQIRDTYDVFLDGLERMNAFAESGLFKPQELAPYLRYWFCNMTMPTGSTEDMRWRIALLAYIQFYGFVGVQRLLQPFVGDISVGGSVWQALRVIDIPLASELEAVCRANA